MKNEEFSVRRLIRANYLMSKGYSEDDAHKIASAIERKVSKDRDGIITHIDEELDTEMFFPRVQARCEWCGQMNGFDEGCCNFCGGHYPSEKEENIPSLAGVVSVDGEIDDADWEALYARASAEANWGAIAKLTNRRI